MPSKKREDNTSDIKKLSEEAILIKVYKAVNESTQKYTDSFHDLDKKVDTLGAQLESTNEKVDRLPTGDQIRLMIHDHKDDCREDRKKSDARHKRPTLAPTSKTRGQVYTVGGLLTGAGVVIGWLLEKFIF